ncbi:unnamed protein product [Symbiodinium microadriaticum]|nr:unnamed protein product [Symbiodinium microadriaticum]
MRDGDADDEGDGEDDEDSPPPLVARADPLPGQRTDESLSQVEQSLLAQFGDVPKYGTKGYDDVRAFTATPMETPEAMKWLKKRRAYSNTAAQGKVFTYEKCSPELQKGIGGSRKVEWEKWKQFNAAIDIDDKHYRELIKEGQEEVKHKSRLVTRSDLESGDIRSVDFLVSHRIGLFWLEYPFMGLMMGDVSFGNVSIKTSATKKGFRENSILKALYALHNKEGRLIALLCTHVDDPIWAAEPEAEPIIEQLLNQFSCGKVERREFRYCGKEIFQVDDYAITVTCKETTLKVKRIFIAGEPLTEKDKTQLKSVAGILNGGTVADLREANKAVDYALATPERGLVYRSGVLDRDNLIS